LIMFFNSNIDPLRQRTLDLAVESCVEDFESTVGDALDENLTPFEILDCFKASLLKKVDYYVDQATKYSVLLHGLNEYKDQDPDAVYEEEDLEKPDEAPDLNDIY